MTSIMQCRQCASVDFNKISDDEYRCRYCGALYLKKSVPIEAGSSPSPARVKRIIPAQMIIIIAALVLMVILSCVAYLFMARTHHGADVRSVKQETSIVSPVGSHGELTEYGSEAIEKEAVPEALYDNISEIPDSIGNVYFAGIYRNTGKSLIRKPMVTILLFSSEGRKIAAGNGYSVRDALSPGEETPVVVLLSNAPKYARYEAKFKPELPTSFNKHRRPKLSFKNVIMKRGQYTGYEISGEVVNQDSVTARWVNIEVIVLSSNKKIIGAASGYLKEDRVAAGDYSPFRIDITTVIGAPHSYKLDYESQTE